MRSLLGRCQRLGAGRRGRPTARPILDPLSYAPPDPLSSAIAERPTVRAPARERPVRTSPRTARWRWLRASASFVAITLLTASAVLGLLDWFLFETPVVARRLPFGDESSPNDKLLLADRHPDTEVLYLGDSRVQYGIHPDVVSRECSCGPGFNAGFSATDPRLTRIMADRLLDKLPARLVVIGVSQWELSDGADIHVWGPAPELVMPWQWAEFGVSVDQPNVAHALLSDTWRIYKYRAALRVALNPWSPDAGRTDPRRGFDEYGGRRRVRERDLDQRQQHWVSSFSVQGRRTEALRGMLADLRGRGVQVLLVAPPLYPNFHARVHREVDMFRAAISGLAADNGVVFEDLTEPRRSGLTQDNFVDVVHLNEGGTTKFSRYVGRVIRSRFGASASSSELSARRSP